MGLELWVCLLISAGVAIGAGGLAGLLAALLLRLGRRRGSTAVLTQIRLCRRPLLAAAVALGLTVVAHGCTALAGWRRGTSVAMILAVCWLLIRAVLVGELILFNRMRMDVEDNRRVRRARTQVTLLRRFVVVLVVVLGIAVGLTTFPPLHAFGASVFASAGVAGIVAGLAAQTTLANMFAGLQLVFTDAIRMDDVVVVETEWGWIEEITLTYVVVHLWDERRLVLPTSYFTSTPFQNWTRNEARVLGSVILNLDYATPLTVLRERAREVIEASPLWDGQDWVLQVTDTTERTIVVRVLASAADGPTAWDLRCEIRESLIVFLQENYPQALPVRRFVSVPGGTLDLDAGTPALQRPAAVGLVAAEPVLGSAADYGSQDFELLDGGRNSASDAIFGDDVDLREGAGFGAEAKSGDAATFPAEARFGDETYFGDGANFGESGPEREQLDLTAVELRPATVRRADLRRAEKLNAGSAAAVPFPRGSRVLRRSAVRQRH